VYYVHYSHRLYSNFTGNAPELYIITGRKND